MKILCIDPGERVGWCHGNIVTHGLRDGVTEAHLGITGHGITALKPFAMALPEAFPRYDIVIYEKFILASGMAMKLAGSDMQTSQLIGMIRLQSWLNPKVKLVGQRPADMRTAEKTVSPEIQRILDGLPKAHDDAHDASALLHLWFYYWKRYV